MGGGRPIPSFGTAGRRPPPRFRSRSWHEHTRRPLAVAPRGRRLRRLRAEHPAGGRVPSGLLARPGRHQRARRHRLPGRPDHDRRVRRAGPRNCRGRCGAVGSAPRGRGGSDRRRPGGAGRARDGGRGPQPARLLRAHRGLCGGGGGGHAQRPPRRPPARVPRRVPGAGHRDVPVGPRAAPQRGARRRGRRDPARRCRRPPGDRRDDDRGARRPRRPRPAPVHRPAVRRSGGAGLPQRTVAATGAPVGRSR